jgi:flagellar basal body-associated protein FliL
MANTTQSDNVDKPLQKVTVVGAKEHAAERSPDSNKKGGLGGVLAWLTIPGLVLLVLIIGYFVVFGLKSNTEQERHGTRAQDTSALYATLSLPQRH